MFFKRLPSVGHGAQIPAMQIILTDICLPNDGSLFPGTWVISPRSGVSFALVLRLKTSLERVLGRRLLGLLARSRSTRHAAQTEFCQILSLDVGTDDSLREPLKLLLIAGTWSSLGFPP
jgi:hypothetical protein